MPHLEAIITIAINLLAIVFWIGKYSQIVKDVLRRLDKIEERIEEHGLKLSSMGFEVKNYIRHHKDSE